VFTTSSTSTTANDVVMKSLGEQLYDRFLFSSHVQCLQHCCASFRIQNL
jgi:hypothetical protein